MPIPPHESERALTALGITQSDLNAIRSAPIDQAQTLLQELKKKAHRQYKKLALELHPDRTQGDKDKAEFFVLLGRVLEEFDKVTVYPIPQPQPVPVMRPIHIYGPNNVPMSWATVSTPWATTSTTATTATVDCMSGRVVRIVRMRPK